MVTMASTPTEPVPTHSADDDGPVPARPMSRRTLLALSLLLAVGVGLFVVAALVGSGDGGGTTVRSSPAIQAVQPGDGDLALQQGRVAIDLAPGYDGQLVTIGGVLVPTSTQTRTAGPGSAAGAGGAAPGGFVDGPEISFLPGDTTTGADTVLDALPLGQVCAVARYWPVADPADVSTVRWCFRVT
jgi:hypothetical protein